MSNEPQSPPNAPSAPKPGDSQWKDNNPKAAFGAAKVGIDYLSLPVLLEQAVGMMAGAYKYGAHNYLVAAPSVMTYVAAAFRHIAAFTGGEEYDPHAGDGVKVHHLTAASNCLHVVRAAMIHGQFMDDRPPPMPTGFIESLADSVAALQRNNPDPVARYLANGRGPGRIISDTTPVPTPVAKEDPTEGYTRADFDVVADHRAFEPPARDLTPTPPAPAFLQRNTFTVPPGFEAVVDSEGRATGELKRIAPSTRPTDD